MLGAVALVVVFAFGLSWIFTTLGMVMRSPNAVMNAGFMSIFPLTFLSNVYVEPETLPAGLEAFVNANPVSVLVTAGARPAGGQPRRRRHRDRARRRRAAHGGVRAADLSPLPPA